MLPGFGGKVNRLFLPFLAKAWRFMRVCGLMHVLRSVLERRLGLFSWGPGIFDFGSAAAEKRRWVGTIYYYCCISVLE